MKKVLISLLIIIVIIIGSKIDVYAKTYTDKFIISTEIEGISYAKVKNGIIEYRKAKFKRRVSDNKIVYCIEPFVDMIENSSYTGYDYNYEALLNISKEDWTRINLLAYYGYGYQGHTENKWYPITQILIWETIDKDATFYWTKTFKGEKIIKYQEEIKELETLVNNHFIKPSFDGQTINDSINKKIILEDKNNVLNKYNLVNKNEKISIENNKLIIDKIENNQELKIELEKKDKIYNTKPIVYISNTYQNILSIGSYESIQSSLILNVQSGQIKITKLDEENKSTIPQGEAKLVGTKFNLYYNGDLFNELVVDETSTIFLDNLPYGNYKLVESQSGEGYKQNINEYYFTIDENNINIELDIFNKVIKRKVKIYKFIEDNNIIKNEGNIIFEIYDKNNNLIQEVKTNEEGECEFDLPYGIYTIKQINTTEGYKKVNDFKIEILEDSDIVLEYFLYDIKIPNTGESNYISVYIIILLFIVTTFGLKLIYEKNN